MRNRQFNKDITKSIPDFLTSKYVDSVEDEYEDYYKDDNDEDDYQDEYDDYVVPNSLSRGNKKMQNTQNRTYVNSSAELTSNIVNSVKQAREEEENNVKHNRKLTNQIENMEKAEQESVAKGLSSDIMFDELLRRQKVLEKAINSIEIAMQGIR